jgi:DGQHR domain-containing protein
MPRLENVIQIIDPSGLKYYLGVMTPSQIMELTFVPCVVRMNEDILNIRTEDSYQREGERNRMKSIKEFYASRPHSIVPPVLLSTRNSWNFTPAKSGSSLGSIEVTDQASIIDGQHRLGGLSLIAQDDAVSDIAHSKTIPFMAIEFETVKDEAEEFEVINGTQKGIKKSHLKFIRRGESFAGNAANMLRDDEGSVFYQRIGIATRADWELITFSAAEDLVKATFDSYFQTNTLFRPDANEDSQAKAMFFLLEYWKTVSEVFGVMWADIELMPAPNVKKSTANPGRGRFRYRLLEETGLVAIAKLGSKILHKSWIAPSQEISWETVRSLLQLVASDERVNLVMQKLRVENKAEIIAIDPQFQFQGKAGVGALHRALEGALDRQ